MEHFLVDSIGQGNDQGLRLLGETEELGLFEGASFVHRNLMARPGEPGDFLGEKLCGDRHFRHFPFLFRVYPNLARRKSTKERVPKERMVERSKAVAARSGRRRY